jgi:hypothetical protein
MKLNYKTLLLAALSILALSAATAASASAHEFTAAKEGNLKSTLPEKLWQFETPNEVQDCTSATVAGKANAGSQTTLIETITLKECYGWHFTPIELEYSAIGTAKLLKTVTMEYKADGCVYTITPTAGNLLDATYANHGTTEISEANKLGFKGESNGRPECGKTGLNAIDMTGTLDLGLEGTSNTLQYK